MQTAICTSVPACKAHQKKQHPRFAPHPLGTAASWADEDAILPPLTGVPDGNPVDPEPLPLEPLAQLELAHSVSPSVSVPLTPRSSVDDSITSSVAPVALPLPDSPSASEDSGSLMAGEGPARGPRKGSGAWWFNHRLSPIAVGSTMTALQTAYSVAELRDHGVTKAATSVVGRLLRSMLESITEPPFALHDVHVPGSTHLIEQVLGVRQANEFEFGWCPTCGFRYPRIDLLSGLSHAQKSELLEETCPQCGTSKFKVLPSVASHAQCVCMHPFVMVCVSVIRRLLLGAHYHRAGHQQVCCCPPNA